MLPSLSAKTLKTYDFSQEQYTVICPQMCEVPNSFMVNNPSNIILLKVDLLEHLPSMGSASSVGSQEQLEVKSETSSMKKERSKERVIFEVIEIVKKWREIHMSKNNFKKISLQEAAKVVGLPKKSLDDYYYQLRLGEKYDFDFKAHLFDRIGVLRTYLKNLKEHSQLDKNEKHPKKLKIIDDFDNLADFFARQKDRMQGMNMMPDMEEEQPEEDYDGYAMKIENEELNEEESRGIQNHFYNEFEYMLNEKDPFLACDYNFKKKAVD